MPDEGRAQREERHEGDPPRAALLDTGIEPRSARFSGFCTHAIWAVLQRVQQVLAGDVAQADAADQPLIARLDHRGQLFVEPRAGLRALDHPQIDGGQLLDAEAAEVVLDPAAQLAGRRRPAASRQAVAARRRPC